MCLYKLGLIIILKVLHSKMLAEFFITFKTKITFLIKWLLSKSFFPHKQIHVVRENIVINWDVS